ncbi:hypothetical protein pdam_00015034 [Pocillopora damicornis]|uniref:Cobalamin-independent methionine synthase MetE C-terminal/archaeal domain-containing protein n=1 Tax=Pocillopora damicornis TaxID=46731 RepID=A0A3M6TS28_POCDA|nr:hypothetical protein pdam_00015034 [Pocillopora damicornis]
MPLSSTVVGCFPKPSYLHIPDWFKTSHSGTFTEDYNRFLETSSKEETEDLIKRATKDIIDIQAEAGIDVISDGELRRESYILHFCRALKGLDFHNLFSKNCRDGACVTDVPRIIGRVTPRESEAWVWKEWTFSQDLSPLPMKITIPGPMTIINSTEDQYYNDDRALGKVLAEIINSEIKALVSAGCRCIQGFTWDGVIGRGARERKNPQGTGLAAHSFIALALNLALNNLTIFRRSAFLMPLSTTVIGSFRKPSYLQIPDWFQPAYAENFPREYNRFLQSFSSTDIEELFIRAIREVIEIQSKAGLDVITDGEVRRENYIHYFCRKLNGFDFKSLCLTSIRDDAATILLPQIVGEVSAQENEGWVWKEWKSSQVLSKLPVKITLPGPMTIAHTVVDQYYKDQKVLGAVLTKILNREIKALVSVGCKVIQVDEPVLMRFPDEALDYGIDQLSTCFDGVTSPDVVKAVHLCCGYPTYLVVLGVVKIASSKVESVEEIRSRLKQVLTVLPAERLVVAPDCGLGFLPTDLAKQKLFNMVQAAKSLP